MPISNYSVLVGVPVSGKVVHGASDHYEIVVKAPGGPYLVALNMQSSSGSEVLYAVKEELVLPDEAGLLALSMGMTPLPSGAGGLALDFIRSEVEGDAPLVMREELTLLPQLDPRGLSEEDKVMNRARSSALQNAVMTLLNMTVADKGGVVYVFGSGFAAVAEKGKLAGIHDIHMNQGNPASRHGGDNGVWQDGAMLIHLPGKKTWVGVFIAFASQSWDTDEVGNSV